MKFCRARVFLLQIGVSALVASPSVASEPAQPQTLPEAAVVQEAQTIKNADLLKLSKPFEVSGVTRFNGWFVVADKILFKSGAQLVFTQQALRDRRNFFLVTKELISEDNNAPGMITFERPAADRAPAKPGQAPSGTAGQSDGSNGSEGMPGEVGTTGPKGFTAPALTIIALSVPQSGPLIDFRGGPGGIGGQGQKGGDGGAGAKGSPASQSMFDCKAGGGKGGNGGAGGRGGNGGLGGQGGDGGTVTIIAPSVLLPSLTQKFRVLVSAGAGGAGGPGGLGGNAGAGGPGGQEARPYCGGGPGGSNGATGEAGTAGGTGPAGIDGDFFVGAISEELFAQIYN